MLSQDFDISYAFDAKLAGFLKRNIMEYGLAKRFSIKIKGTYGCELAHLCAGGVLLDQVDEKYGSVLDSRIKIAGEMLDFDALCGGYNLMHAIISGLIAGEY
jgi:predicted flavoprotein YhiN